MSFTAFEHARCPARYGRAALVLVLMGMVPGGIPGGDALPVTVAVKARAVKPGEPVRIEVTSSTPLRSLEGVFLDRKIFMVRTRSGPDGREAWSGWTMVGLDRQPGPVAVDVAGVTAAGDRVVGTRAVTVEPEAFPEEALEVPAGYVEPPPEVQARLARERERTAAVYASRSPRVPATRPFVRPVPGESTSVFGTRRTFNGQARDPHPGIDLRARKGTAVLSAGAGKVGLAADLYYSGNTVIVDHGGGLFTIYAHLSKILVREGREIEAGETIGLSGATGRVTGPHLHWGAKIGSTPFDPLALLDERLF